jgi:uncharacterized membrane protein YqjE
VQGHYSRLVAVEVVEHRQAVLVVHLLAVLVVQTLLVRLLLQTLLAVEAVLHNPQQRNQVVLAVQELFTLGSRSKHGSLCKS